MLCLCTSMVLFMMTLILTSKVGEVMFFIWVCAIFLTFSGNFALFPTVTAKTFGAKYVAVNFGILFTSQVSLLLSTTFWIEKKNNAYQNSNDKRFHEHESCRTFRTKNIVKYIVQAVLTNAVNFILMTMILNLVWNVIPGRFDWVSDQNCIKYACYLLFKFKYCILKHLEIHYYPPWKRGDIGLSLSVRLSVRLSVCLSHLI